VTIDFTHDPQRRSWVESANDHADFPIQNLPLGVFSSPDDPSPRIGIAIGDRILDVKAASRDGLLQAVALPAASLEAATLNQVMAAGAEGRRQLRACVSALLERDAPERQRVARTVLASRECTMHVPAVIGDYTDFYAGIHHALNVGRQFRPDQPLMPNYKYVPIGYHGRASSVVV
jgi:fumarylacetoacetase